MNPPSLTRRSSAVTPTTLVVAGMVAGLIARIHGLVGGSGLFRDDAWVAAPGRTTVGHAADLASTFPGFSLGLWPWLHLTAPSVLAAQVPAFLAGMAVLPVLWWAFRRFDVAPWIAAAVAVAISLSPVVITYSTRVKPYTTELVLAAVVLALSTTPSKRRGWWPLALMSAVAFTVSFATAPVIAGAWITVVLRERKTRGLTRRVGVPCFSAGAATLVVLALTWHPVPPSLRAFWQPFFVDWSSPAAIARSAERLFGGLSSGLTGAPLLTTSRPFTTAFALLVLGTLGALCLIGVTAARRRALAPVLSVLLALVLSCLHLVPFGSGRTDEVLYPALGLLMCFGLTRLLEGRRVVVNKVVAVGTALATGLAVIFAVTLHRAEYPVSDLNAALVLSRAHGAKDAQVLVIDAPLRYNFAWSGFEELRPPARVWLEATSTNEAGYTVKLATHQPQLFLADADHGDSTYHPQRWARAVRARVAPGASIVFLSITEQVVNPTTGHLPGQALDPHRSPFWKAFRAQGWKPGAYGVVRGVYFQTLTAPSSRP